MSSFLYGLFIFGLVASFLEILVFRSCRDDKGKCTELAWTFVVMGCAHAFKSIFPIFGVGLLYEITGPVASGLLGAAGSWQNYLLSYLVLEFTYYWQHRYSHQTCLGWTSHAVHHQPKNLNLFAANREGMISRWFSLAPFLYIPTIYLGVSVEVFSAWAILAGRFNLFCHFHKALSFGWLDYVFTSPKNHLNHHALNKDFKTYNYGRTLMIFDVIFGTYTAQPKTAETKYGLYEDLDSNSVGNPFLVSLKIWYRMAKKFQEDFLALKRKSFSGPNLNRRLVGIPIQLIRLKSRAPISRASRADD